MVNYWLFVITQEKIDNEKISGIKIFKTLMKKKVWGIAKGTQNRKNIEIGDKILFYCGSGSGAFTHTFVGTAKVEEKPKLLTSRKEILADSKNLANYQYELKLKNIKIWSSPKPIKPYIKNLKIIKKPDRWGTYLQGGIIRLKKDDYNVIYNGEKTVDIKLKKEKSPQSMGAWFEKHIAAFVKKMDLKDVSIKEDFGGPHEVDVVAGFEEYLFLIECKWRRKDTAPNSVKNYVSSIRGKSSLIKKSAKKHKIYSKYSKHIFILATRNHKIKKRDEEYCRKASPSKKIYIWDEKFVDYYSNLKSILGSYSVYNMIGEMNIKPKEKIPFRIPAFRTKIDKYKVYNFFINPKSLLRYCYVARRGEGKEEYYQRIIDGSRLNKIKKFIDEEKGFFANNIILSIKEKTIFHPDREIKKQEEWPNWLEFGILQFPKSYRSLWIVDGQHRLYSFSKSDRTSLIPVVAFDNMKLHEQTKLFIDINENQKAVDPDLMWDLHSELRKDKEEGIISNSVKKISEKSLEDKIYIPLQGGKKSKKPLKLSGICIAIKRCGLIKTNSKSMNKKQRNPLYSKNISKRKLNLSRALNQYFDVIKNNADEKFRDNFLYTNGGVSVLIYLYERLLARYKNKLDNNKIEKCLSLLFDHLKGADLKLYVDRLNSEGGRKGVVEEFISVIALDLPDEELRKSITPLLDYEESARKLEKDLRDFLNKKFSKNDKNWIKHKLDEQSYKRIKRRYNETVPEDPRKLYEFLGLGEIKNLIKRQDVFNALKETFIGRRAHFVSKADFIGSLDLIIKYRNPPSHGEYLKIDHTKLQRIKTTIETFRRCIESSI